MRAVLEKRVPRAEVLDGTAEAIPLADASVDGVTVAQAFHWFDREPALREIARILKPDRALAIVANIRDKRDELQEELEELMSRYRGTYPNAKWPEKLDDDPLFEAERRTFRHEQLLDRGTFVERVSSVSWIASLPEGERARVLDATRAMAARRDEPIRLPYETEVFICRRRHSAQSTA
jgi:SAM-dependent methyltransferase